MPTITCIEDLKRLAKRRAPKMFYDYCESGSWTGQSFRENTTAFQELYFRQRIATDMTRRSTKAKMLGEEVAMPLALAPVGMTGMQHADGEILAAQAAEAFGVPFCLSTMSICSIEDVAAHTTKPFWFQLYTMKDTGYLTALIERARAAGCSALVITLDLQVLGQRHNDLKNGLTAPPKLTLPVIADLATKWRWGLGMMRTKRRGFGNIVGHVQGVKDTRSLANFTHDQFDPALDWDRVAELKELWGGKVIFKGIMEVEDAKRAAEVGCDALVVSNHGGRQLDGALPAIKALQPIVEAVGDQTEVWMDSGIRSGQDMLKAYALGAKGMMSGRAWIYGLAALGKPGVTRALEILQHEMEISMALCGTPQLEQVSRDILRIPKGFHGEWE